MKRLPYLLEKEFLQIFRNKGMLPIIFIMPVIQLIVLSFAATYELKNVSFYVVDHDRSEVSEKLIQKFESNKYFSRMGSGLKVEAGRRHLAGGAADMVMVLPPGMEQKMQQPGPVRVLIMIDAVSSNKAGLIQSYSQVILRDFNASLVPRYSSYQKSAKKAGISISRRFWYNPTLEYINYMVPGILVVLVTMIGLFLSAMNVVREQEIGTMEQLNVTPMRRSEFIAGKLLPLWMLALFELGVGLAVSVWGFGVPLRGSLTTIYLCAAVYLIAAQGIGLYISTVTNTQQQSMFISWFIMVIFILMGGLFTPIESMPLWAQKLTYLNPVAYFIDIMRSVMLKGAGFSDFPGQLAVLILFAVVSITFSILQYQKVSGS